MNADTPHSFTFRQELLSRIATAVCAGECCSLVGISGVGKSNLVQFLRRIDIQEHYWRDRPTWLVAVDTHSLVFEPGVPQEYVVAELLIHRLIRESELRSITAETVADMERMHRMIIAKPSVLLAFRYLERICGKLIEGHNIRLVFMFDQFEDIWASLSARLFLNLRSLRDEFKYRLIYLVMTRNRLPMIRERIVQDSTAVEAFWELFGSHTYGIGAYTMAESEEMFNRMEQRNSTQANQLIRQLAFQASGGHPGLLRAIYWSLRAQSAPNPSLEQLITQKPIWDECLKIWREMTTDEQQIMRRVAVGEHIEMTAEGALPELLLSELLLGDPPHIGAPILATFIQHQNGVGMQGIVVDPVRREVWRDGILLKERLSPLEFSLIEYLASRVGQICTRDDLMSALYGEKMYDRNDERLETLLRRLRKTLSASEYVITERGVGVRLTKGGIMLME